MNKDCSNCKNSKYINEEKSEYQCVKNPDLKIFYYGSCFVARIEAIKTFEVIVENCPGWEKDKSYKLKS